jgi:selenocysteine-specific elongation factor
MATEKQGDIAFVDVPGHERFVKNMISGAGGIDAVMLVVAADDGWMPQSQEHFDIVRLLGVNQGFLAINKVDLVESDWVDLLEADIRERLAGSFLSDAPAFRLSAVTGQGFAELESYLETYPECICSRSRTGKARLYIDRAFVQPGIGRVVTGTLRGDKLTVGQTVAVWPSNASARIRTLQSQSKDVSEVEPGHRTAISFTGLDKEMLLRGGVITDQTNLDYYRDNPVLALQVELLPNAPVSLTDNRRATILVGTSESEGALRPYGTSEIRPGTQGCVFFRPDQPVYSLIGDHFIIRLPTPMITLGGGRVIDHLPRFPRRKELSAFGYLHERLAEGPLTLIISELHKRCLVPESELFEHADMSEDDLRAGLEVLVSSGRVARFGSFVYLVNQLQDKVTAVIEAVENELSRQSHLKGLAAEQIYALTNLPKTAAEAVLEYMVHSGTLVRHRDLYSPSGRKGELQGAVRKAYDEIMSELRAKPFGPPGIPFLARKGKAYQQAIGYIIEGGEAHKCGADFLFLADVWTDILTFIAERLQDAGTMAVTELREKFGFTRKYAIPVLEETDRTGFTKRDGDVRVKGDNFGKTLADL